MRLTPALTASLNRVWKRDANAQPALTLSYAGTSMTWTVADLVLTTAVVGGLGQSLSINLKNYTLATLATYLAGQTGYTVTNLNSTLSGLGAMVLLDGSGASGQPLQAFTRLSWAILDAMASELQNAENCAALAPLMIAVDTAQGYWLDQLGKILGGCARIPNEPDALYGPRMIAQIIAPKGNNVAIAIALEEVFGFTNVTVTDVVLNLGAEDYSGAIKHDGSHRYDGAPVIQYGLFDISGNYAGPYPASEIGPYVTAFLNALRVAGCHARNINLGGVTVTPL